MKIFKLIIGAIITIYLQLILAPKMEVFYVVPNLVLPFVIYVSVLLNLNSALTFAFIIGLICDLTYPTLFGLASMNFLVISWLTNHFHQNINKEKFLPVLLSFFILNLIYFFGYWLVRVLTYDNAPSHIMIFITAIVYNTIISLVFSYLVALIDRLQISFDV